jgi:hypothetical protein
MQLQPRIPLALVAVLLLLAFRASSETVSFEGLPSMVNLQTVAPTAARLSNQLASVSGVVFSSAGGSPHVAVVQLGQGHAASGTNGIGGVNAAGALNYGTPIQANFVMPSDPAIPAVVDFVSVACDRASIPGTVTMEAFDPLGAPLGSITATIARTGLRRH